MDKVTLESDLEEAEAQLASSKTEYEYRMKEYLRTKQLYDKELVSDAEYDESLYLYETAKNTYAQHQASIVGIRRNLGYATITSPIDGVVISRAVEEGQTVAAGFETPTLFTIANDLTDMQVIAMWMRLTSVMCRRARGWTSPWMPILTTCSAELSNRCVSKPPLNRA